MTRKLALLLAVCLGFWQGPVWALGLGEIEVRSALNERFSATIELRRIETLSQNEVIASLASAEDFSRLGVQRFFYLSELEFTTDFSDRSRPRIVVSSNRPINEPFVNFIVDVRWPTGRMLREYTVLLDPPTYAERPAPAVRPAEAATPARTQPERVRAEPGEVRTAAQPSPGAGRFDGERYGVTDRNDTLWAIALEVRPSADVSVHQTMLALQRANPQAFIGGNINLLKAGYVLEVPGADEIARLSRQDAIMQVAEHNSRWRDGTPAMPIDARPEVAVGDQPARPSGQLRLVAGEDDDLRVTREAAMPAGSGAVSGEAVDELRGELADAEARLRESEAARSAAERQRQEAVSELEQVSRQLELRNQELARLQRQLAAQQQAPAAASRPAARGPFGMDWMLLAAVLLGLLVIVVAILLLLRRRRAQPDEGPVAETQPPVASKPIEQTQLMSAISEEDLVRAGIGSTAVGSAAVGGADASDAGAEGEESDVIAEADVYMAYGRFSEAARVLNAAIEADGQRADLRLKLMEVLVETQDVEAFNAQAEVLRGFADSQTIALADDLASRLPGAVTSTGATSQGESAVPARAADEGEVSLDFDLGDDFGEPADLDSLDIDFDASRPAAAAAAAAEQDADDDDLPLLLDGDRDPANTDAGLDIDFDFDEPEDAAKPAETAERGDEGHFGLDLDEDQAAFDETLTDAEPAVRDAVSDARGMDDFDLELPAADEPAAPGALAEGPLAGTEGEPERDATQPAEAAGSDSEFDLTLDGSGFIEQPQVSTGTDAEDDESRLDFDFDTDLASDAAAAGDEAETAEPLTRESIPAEQAPASEGDIEVDDEDLSFDFDIDDLPAPTPAAEVGSDAERGLRTEPEDELSAAVDPTPGREGIDAEDAAGAGLDGDSEAAPADLAGEGFEGDDDVEPVVSASPAAAELPVDVAEDDIEFGMDFDEAGDETTTKLELARAYIDMGDEDGAKEILDEVVRDGSDTQQQEAAELLARIV